MTSKANEKPSTPMTPQAAQKIINNDEGQCSSLKMVFKQV